MIKLYSYFRSSASYRVRIALHYKQLNYTLEPIHLLREGGEQFQTNYLALNPQSLVPTLIDGGVIITQSLAIMEYLEEVYRDLPILPNEPAARARVRMLSQIVACDMHPLNNLRVLKYLTETLKINNDEKQRWYDHWLTKGFDALEKLLTTQEKTGEFCYGDTPTLADMCLVPQIYNAERFSYSLENYPTLQRIYARCMKLPAFQEAHPDKQKDAPGI